MAKSSDKWLVETDWLENHMRHPDVVVVDGSWHLPGTEHDPYQEYLDERIPDAVFFDIDRIADTENPLPHMLPSPETFAFHMRRLGIGDGMRVVVYDSQGMFSAARVWWTFRAMGSDNVAVLNGGLPKWKAEGRPLGDGPEPARKRRDFTARLDERMVRDRDAVLGIVEDGSEQILDARSADRFAGHAPEPRPGLRAGHIPGSLNLPYDALVNADGTLKAPEELKKAFETAGVDFAKPVATTCGSGVTASILALALELLGHERVAVYDGSWSEWGADETLPVETGG